MKQKSILIWAIVFIATSILLGAFGAHALKPILTENRSVSFETGVRYQMYHGLALLAIGAMADKWTVNFKLPVMLLLIGTLLFSTTLYGLALQDVWNVNLSFLGPFTPIGGTILIGGWVVLALRIAKQ